MKTTRKKENFQLVPRWQTHHNIIYCRDSWPLVDVEQSPIKELTEFEVMARMQFSTCVVMVRLWIVLILMKVLPSVLLAVVCNFKSQRNSVFFLLQSRNMSENRTVQLQPQSTSGSAVSSACTSSESTITITSITTITAAQQAAEDVKSASSSNYVGRRGLKRKAPLWNYFDEIKNGNEIFAVCKQADCSYKNKGKNNSTLKII